MHINNMHSGIKITDKQEFIAKLGSSAKHMISRTRKFTITAQYTFIVTNIY